MGGVKLTALSCALSKTEAFSDILPVDLEPMQVKGLCHAHVRIAHRGLILRIPRESSLGLSPEENLAYQQMSFERASVGGHTPVLHGTIPPQDEIPMGALIVLVVHRHSRTVCRQLLERWLRFTRCQFRRRQTAFLFCPMTIQ